jgi:hypothetical protein
VYTFQVKIVSTDELFKSAAYLTEAFTGVQLPSAPTAASTATIHPARDDAHTCVPEFRNPWDDTDIPCFTNDKAHTSHPLAHSQPTQVSSNRKSAGSRVEIETLPAFNLAFNTPVPFFEWLEDGGLDALGGSGIGAGCLPPGNGDDGVHSQTGHARKKSTLSMQSGRELRKSFRLERFSQEMTGTSGWEAPGAILSGMFPFVLRLCLRSGLRGYRISDIRDLQASTGFPSREVRR